MDQEREVPEEGGGGTEKEGEGKPHEGENNDDEDEACVQHHLHRHHHRQVCVLKFDHFENIHRLDPKLPSYEGAPNFRQVKMIITIILMTIISPFDCNIN